MTYPLGGYGWMPKLKAVDSNNYITALQFYAYKLNVRNNFNQFLN